jgi:uncharacterized protein (TIGR03437 family)
MHTSLPLRLHFVFCLGAALAAAQPATDTPWPTERWVVSTPEQQGMDSAKLEQASRFIEQKCPTRFSLLVVRHGRIVFERYYLGTRAGDANVICSMSKSILSVLAGIAFDEGKLHSLDQRLEEFFPEYINANSDARKRQIRLKDVLTMTAGLRWDDLGDRGAPGGDLSRCLTSRDWLRCMLEAPPMKADPGDVFNYDSGLTHTFSAILSKVTGMTARSYAASRLFAPLGIYCPRWSQDPQGYSVGGWDVWMTVRDVARFGLLALRNGEWDGRRIVSAEWMDTSTKLRVRTGDAGWGFGDYGYYWWKKTIAGYPTTLASGYGGQNLFLVPELDLLVVSTARADWVPPLETYMQPYDIMAQFVLPAVKADLPFIEPGSIVQVADGSAVLAAGSFAAATGSGFSLVERNWDYAMPADGRLPECIAGMCVQVDKRVAHVRYVSPSRVEFLLPPDLPPGRHTIVLRTPQGTSSADVDIQEIAPALYTKVRDGMPFASDQPVRAGSLVTLYASGLGPATPPVGAGEVVQRPLPLRTQPRVLVAGREAAVTDASLFAVAVWQVSIRLPEALPAGIVPIQVCSGTICSAAQAVIETISE